MLDDNRLVLVTPHHGLQFALSKTISIGDTKYQLLVYLCYLGTK